MQSPGATPNKTEAADARQEHPRQASPDRQRVAQGEEDRPPSSLGQFLWAVLVGSPAPSSETITDKNNDSDDKNNEKNNDKNNDSNDKNNEKNNDKNSDKNNEKNSDLHKNDSNFEDQVKQDQNDVRKKSTSSLYDIVTDNLSFIASTLLGSPPFSDHDHENEHSDAGATKDSSSDKDVLAKAPSETSEKSPSRSPAKISISLVDRRADVAPVLLQQHASQLVPHLPSSYQSSTRWHLVYSLEQHGISLTTLYARLSAFCDKTHFGNHARCPSIIVLKDEKGTVFGGFVTDLWRQNSGSGHAQGANIILHSSTHGSGTAMMAGSVSSGRSYYGTGECFVFNVDSTQLVHVFPWTGKNDYYMLSESDFLAMGGGDGKFSFFIDSDLYQGCSFSAPTFSNTGPLCASSDGKFECVGVEVWGISY